MRASRGSGTAQPVQDAGLGEFHASRLSSVVMVVAGQMQRAVHDEMGEVMRRTASGGGGLAADHAERQHDLRCGFEVGEHIGRPVAAAMAGVEAAHRSVGGQHDGGLGAIARGAGGAGGNRFGARYQPAPAGSVTITLTWSRIPACAGQLLPRGPSLLAGSIPGWLISRARRASRRFRLRPRRAVIGLDDAGDQRMADHVARAEPGDGDALARPPAVDRIAQAGAARRAAGRSGWDRR